MDITDFVKELRQDILDFHKWWNEEPRTMPDDANYADWQEQFDIWKDCINE